MALSLHYCKLDKESNFASPRFNICMKIKETKFVSLCVIVDRRFKSRVYKTNNFCVSPLNKVFELYACVLWNVYTVL